MSRLAHRALPVDDHSLISIDSRPTSCCVVAVGAVHVLDVSEVDRMGEDVLRGLDHQARSLLLPENGVTDVAVLRQDPPVLRLVVCYRAAEASGE